MNKYLQGLIDAFATKRQAKRVSPGVSRYDVNSKNKTDPNGRGKSRRGAHHKQGRVFLGRQIMPMTPAQYRHSHAALRNKKAKS